MMLVGIEGLENLKIDENELNCCFDVVFVFLCYALLYVEPVNIC